MAFGDDNFVKFEENGVKEAKNAAFVLVAGGLGERLGYNGIKVESNFIYVELYLLRNDSCIGWYTCDTKRSWIEFVRRIITLSFFLIEALKWFTHWVL